MEKQLIDMVVSYGVFGLLFISLYLKTQKDNDKRELNYQNTITKLIEKFEILEDIKEKIEKL